MDILITFFRDTIDGWLYYVILVLNTVLIFAIIGYIGEKKTALMLEQSKQFDEINRETLKVIGINTLEEDSVQEQQNNNTATAPQTIPRVPQTQKNMEVTSKPASVSIETTEQHESIPAVLDLDDVSKNSK